MTIKEFAISEIIQFCERTCKEKEFQLDGYYLSPETIQAFDCGQHWMADQILSLWQEMLEDPYFLDREPGDTISYYIEKYGN